MEPNGARPDCPSYPDCLNCSDWKPEHCVDCEWYCERYG